MCCEECKKNNKEKHDLCKVHHGFCEEYGTNLLHKMKQNFE